jgi:DNA-binding transcriptional ArsR family regulator
MVEQSIRLDLLFGSLADPTRRDILKRVAVAEMSVSDIAQYYDLTFAAVSKHLMMLEKAKLITKRRWGKQRMVQLEPSAIKDVSVYLKQYEKLWNKRLDSLEHYLTTIS